MPDELKNPSLEWSFVLLLSGIAGTLYATLTIFAWVRGVEGSVVLMTLVILGLLVARRVSKRPVRHGFVTGFISAFLAIELQALFLPLYFANNPEYALIEIPFGLPARLATAIFAPLQATLAGGLTAGFVWLWNRIWPRAPRSSEG